MIFLFFINFINFILFFNFFSYYNFYFTNVDFLFFLIFITIFIIFIIFIQTIIKDFIKTYSFEILIEFYSNFLNSFIILNYYKKNLNLFLKNLNLFHYYYKFLYQYINIYFSSLLKILLNLFVFLNLNLLNCILFDNLFLKKKHFKFIINLNYTYIRNKHIFLNLIYNKIKIYKWILIS